jgi:hypothetical protein
MARLNAAWSRAQPERGEIKFIAQCPRCHVFGQSVTPDPRKLPAEIHSEFKDVVLKGELASPGDGAVR